MATEAGSTMLMKKRAAIKTAIIVMFGGRNPQRA